MIKQRVCCRCGEVKSIHAFGLEYPGVCRTCIADDNYQSMYNGFSPAGGDGGKIQGDPAYAPAFYPKIKKEKREVEVKEVKLESEVLELHHSYLNIPVDEAVELFKARYDARPVAAYRRMVVTGKATHTYLYLTLPDWVKK